ncbi:MAG: hypothetical protein J0H46_11215 [Bacteroidetes bacterium]|nr:hypothetical protein [Bacteroidota bacterium]
MPLKYQKEIDGLNLQNLCPTETVSPLGVEVFRWSYNPITHERNFLPNVVFDRIINHPYPYHIKDNPTKCKRCGASFFTTIKSAVNAWENMSAQNKANLGYTHIASGILDEKDGLINKPSVTGHFGFYEFDTADLTRKFKILSELKNA